MRLSFRTSELPTLPLMQADGVSEAPPCENCNVIGLRVSGAGVSFQTGDVELTAMRALIDHLRNPTLACGFSNTPVTDS